MLDKTKEISSNLKELRGKLPKQPFALSSEGMNFAIPINDIKYAADQLIQHGEVNYGWLGVDAQAVPPSLQSQLGLKEHGVLIKNVTHLSPAEKAGLKQWDVILYFDDTEVDTPKTLQRLVRRTSPGQKVSIKVIRKVKTLTLTLEVGTKE
jgi:serine protease Do